MRGRRDGRTEGREEGRREGEAALLLRLLQRKFGPLDEDVRARVRAADPELLLEWAERIPAARRLQDVFSGS
jgi:predicted transposase YdaD